MTSKASAISIAALALALASQAHAAAPAPADPAPAAASGEEPTIQEIVVTATKRETNLQKTPISISVVNAQVIKDRHIQSLYDLADGGVPSLRVATFEARQSALTIGIRGIVPLDANQPAREQGVGIYVDGVYLARQHGLNAALFDIERIEVLKGPQGTLFGRNSEGGALSIISKAPSGKFGGSVNAGYGNYGAYTIGAHLDLPEFHNLSVKLDGIKQYQNATTKDPLPGSTGWNYYDRQGFRGAVRWKPSSDITNDFSVDVAQDKNTPFYSQLLNYNPNGCANGAVTAATTCVLPSFSYTTLTGGPVKPLLPGVVVNGTSRMTTADIGVPQQPSVDKSHGFTNNFKWKLSPEVEIRSITAWRGVDMAQYDNSGGAHRVPTIALTAACTAAAPCAFSRYSLADLRQRQFSQELQAVGSIDRIDYVAGLFYFNEHVSDDAATPASIGAVAITDGLGNVTGANYVTIPFCTGSTPLFVGKAVNGCSIDRASAVRSRSYAAYGQATWNATDALHITVGGRYTKDKKEGVLTFFNNLNYATATPAQLAANGYQPLDKTWNRFNPMATIAYDVTNGLHVYAKYSTGYRAGGASSRTPNYLPFNPEDLKSYEVGLKSDFWDHRARFNLAGYIMDRKNSQEDLSFITTANGASVNVLRAINAPGITKIRGVEADLTVAPVTGLTLNLSYAYTYTHIPLIPVTFTVGAVTSAPVLQQFYIPFTPRNAASGSIDYALPVGGGDTKVKVHIDGNYSQSAQGFDQFPTKAGASFIVNSRLSLADIGMSNAGQKLTVSLWVRNMFDKQYIFRQDPSNSLPGAPTSAAQLTTGAGGPIQNVLGDYGNFNAPRTFGIEGTVTF
ncbi:iron complex outermembrane receptor protein [Sphingomonas vulcanisoli]|uniref:Iron complex outermembrane receptor protein n=1 Tax=Sphingomonas vulcanisoli TaxID=1658060 RepID=A0ABX0TRG2_9SPHN|nr:TonB-dependent receptor [Sphingomonas vulcanisoli]NIJ08113.1 iron complex outermembrane receptor protein [Sphingomonas vulcanisoli]